LYAVEPDAETQKLAHSTVAKIFSNQTPVICRFPKVIVVESLAHFPHGVGGAYGPIINCAIRCLVVSLPARQCSAAHDSLMLATTLASGFVNVTPATDLWCRQTQRETCVPIKSFHSTAPPWNTVSLSATMHARLSF